MEEEVTMEDIAEEAGVSKATVSRVINEDSYVSEETREQVMEVVRKYNYQPHTVARGLARDLSHTIGLAIPGPPRNITDPFFLEFLHGVGNKAATYDFSVSLPTIKDDSVRKLYEEAINFNRIDGMIVVNPKIDDFRIEYLRNKNIPFVFLGRTFSDEQVAWVDGDNVGGAYEAAEYLINQGHTEIACISGDVDFVASHLRQEGYRQALADNNLNFKQNLIARGDFTRDSGYQAMKVLLGRSVSFTAVFVINDAMAMGAIKALKEAGIKVPEECAVMGFDGIDLGAYIDPQLSTMRQPIYQLGVEACETIIKLITGDQVVEKQKVLPIEKLIREST